MKKSFIKSFDGLIIKPYYLEIYEWIFVFALTGEQFVKALCWYNVNVQDVFSAEDMEQLLKAKGLTASHVQNIKSRTKRGFQCIYVPIDELIKQDDLVIEQTPIQKLMHTVGHEIQHAVLNCADQLKGDLVSPTEQEPLAYLSGWLSAKFFEEAQRQGFDFSIKYKKPNDKSRKTT